MKYNNNIELGIPAYTNDGIYCGQSFTFSTPDIDNKECFNYKYFMTCTKQQFPLIEMALFRLEFNNDPGIEPFYIDVADDQRYYYYVKKAYSKYYITTK